MEEKTISYLAFESATSRQERTIKRLWITNLILIFIILAMVALFLYHESQFETVEKTVTQEIEACADGDSDMRILTVGGNYDSESEDQTSDKDQDQAKEGWR